MGFAAVGLRQGTGADSSNLEAEPCFCNANANAELLRSVNSTALSGSVPGGRTCVNVLDVQPLRVKVAFGGDPGSEGGRGPEVLLSLLPRFTTHDYRRQRWLRQSLVQRGMSLEPGARFQ